MTEELIQNVVDILDNAHTHKIQLAELLNCLQEAQNQVHNSANAARKELKDYFNKLKSDIGELLNKRLKHLIEEVDSTEKSACVPLTQCEDMINSAVTAANNIMEQGKNILSDDPKSKVAEMIALKDNPDTRTLNSVPAIPNLSDVPYISAEMSHTLCDRVAGLINKEAKVWEQAPVKIYETVERPGGILVKWTEDHTDMESSEFCLQFGKDNRHFHDAYTGTALSYTVKGLKMGVSYYFRVKCKHNTQWSVCCVPIAAVTNLTPYEWTENDDSYSSNYENKIASRLDTGSTKVFYSRDSSYQIGHPITFRVLESGETTYLDCIGLCINRENEETLQREQTVLVTVAGRVFVDGQEMKIRLPEIKKGCSLTFETEDLMNGKVRVTIELSEKVVTFDWKTTMKQGMLGDAVPGILGGGLPGMFGGGLTGVTGQSSATSNPLYFGIRFSHEGWKVMVE